MPKECKKNFCWERKRKAKSCAAGSIRTLTKKGGKVLVRVCCPKGRKHWTGRSCKVGMVTQSVGRVRTNNRDFGAVYPLVKDIKKVTLK